MSNKTAKPMTFQETLHTYLQPIQLLLPNWDGQGALVPTIPCFEHALTLLLELPDWFTEKLDQDSFTPTPYGTIVVDWDREADCFSLEFGTSKIGWFLKINDEFVSQAESRDYDDPQLLHQIKQCLYQLYNFSCPFCGDRLPCT